MVPRGSCDYVIFWRRRYFAHREVLPSLRANIGIQFKIQLRYTVGYPHSASVAAPSHTNTDKYI